MREKIKSLIFVKTTKNKVLKGFVLFLLFMLVCTIISRGIYTMQMPQISVGTLESKSIEHTIEADGVISAGKETAVLAFPGVHISEVCVRPGQQVEKGTVLLRLDIEEIKKYEDQAKDLQQIAETKFNDANTNAKLMNEETQKDINRASQDIEALTGQQNKEIGRAEKEVENAAKDLEEFPSLEDYINSSQLQGIQKNEVQLPEDDNKNDDNKNDDNKNQDTTNDEKSQQDDTDAGEVKIEQLKQDWKEKKEALEKALEDKKNALQDAKDTKNQEMTEANRKLEDAADVQVNHSTILELKQDLEQANQNVQDIQMLAEKNGEICSEISGNITKINCNTGDKTGDTACMVIADGTNGWTYTAVIDQEQKKFVTIGDTINLSFNSGKTKIDDIAISSIQKVDGNNYEIEAQVPAQDLILGESGSFSLVKQSERFAGCVPLSALYAGSNNNYILVVRENDTILGTELSVEKIDVTVLDKNTKYAAIECSGIAAEDKIVIQSDRTISPGDKVRLLEAE